jgi:hypothetical protein
VRRAAAGHARGHDTPSERSVLGKLRADSIGAHRGGLGALLRPRLLDVYRRLGSACGGSGGGGPPVARHGLPGAIAVHHSARRAELTVVPRGAVARAPFRVSDNKRSVCIFIMS